MSDAGSNYASNVSSSGRRMTRKERQAKKQLTIIHKSNEENRLPVGARATHIDGGSVESDDDFKELKSK